VGQEEPKNLDLGKMLGGRRLRVSCLDYPRHSMLTTGIGSTSPFKIAARGAETG
jgi:hypothetical protein